MAGMELTRRRYPERPDCWHVYYGDVQVGTIARRAGRASGRYVSDFRQARSDFEAAWAALLPKRTEADFLAWRRQKAWTDWKYAMHESHCRMPTQNTSGQSRCFCGVAIDLKNTEEHVYSAHMTGR
jgi:hypothetical protein